MNDWMTIPADLQAAGFTVCYDRISYAASNPLWRAKADRDGRTWSALGRDLETALVELEHQTKEAVADWRAPLSQERSRPIVAESAAMVWHTDETDEPPQWQPVKTIPHPTTRRPGRLRRMSARSQGGENRVPRKWRWHYQVLESLRAPLLEEVRESLARNSEVNGPRNTYPADSASEESDRALALCLLSGEQDALHEVDSAIRRILSGSYGICERTGKRIPAMRLRAMPWARYTKEEQDALESQRASQGSGGAKAAI